MLKNTRTILQIILFFLILSISAAYLIEYGLGHKPCKLCIYQRIPYFVSLILLINILVFKKFQKFSLFFLSIVMLAGAIIAFYHLGIEQGFFNESFICKSGDLSNVLTAEEILNQLKNNTISCKEVSFKLFGFSLASINTIFSLALFYIFMKLFNNYETN